MTGTLDIRDVFARVAALTAASQESERARADRDAWAVAIARRWVASLGATGEPPAAVVTDDFALVAFEAAERRVVEAAAALRRAIDAMEPGSAPAAEATS